MVPLFVTVNEPPGDTVMVAGSILNSDRLTCAPPATTVVPGVVARSGDHE